MEKNKYFLDSLSNKELLRINKSSFYEYYKYITPFDINYIWKNNKNWKLLLKVDRKTFNKVLLISDLELINKIYKFITIENLLEIYVNEPNILCPKHFWNNINVKNNLNIVYKFLNKSDKLYFLNFLEDSLFNKLLTYLNFYYLNRIVDKLNEHKLRILINNIQSVYLDDLINSKSENFIKFIKDNLYSEIKDVHTDYLFELEEIDNYELDKIQIILLIGTILEEKIINHILSFDFKFINSIINLCDPNTSLELIKRLSINDFYILLPNLSCSNLIEIIPTIEKTYIGNMINLIPQEKLHRIIPYLEISHFLESLNYLNDEKLIIFVNNMSEDIKNHFYLLANDLNSDLYEDYISNFSKQILCCLFNTNIGKEIIMNNLNQINKSKLLLLTNFMDNKDFLKLFESINNNNRRYILSNLENKYYLLIDLISSNEYCDLIKKYVPLNKCKK